MGDSGGDTWATQEAPASGAVLGAHEGAVELAGAPARNDLEVVESAI